MELFTQSPIATAIKSNEGLLTEELNYPTQQTPCDQCEPVMINGRYCHEHGCPNARRVFSHGEWRVVYTCHVCGYETIGEACECTQGE